MTSIAESFYSSVRKKKLKRSYFSADLGVRAGYKQIGRSSSLQVFRARWLKTATVEQSIITDFASTYTFIEAQWIFISPSCYKLYIYRCYATWTSKETHYRFFFLIPCHSFYIFHFAIYILSFVYQLYVSTTWLTRYNTVQYNVMFNKCFGKITNSDELNCRQTVLWKSENDLPYEDCVSLLPFTTWRMVRVNKSAKT